MKLFFLSLLMLSFSVSQATSPDPLAPGADAKSQELLEALEKANGGWKKLAKRKDVEFTYTYDDHRKKAKDISLERYIFAGEMSGAMYSHHKVNVIPDQEGPVVQSLIDGKPMTTLNGKAVDKPEAQGMTAFLRSANYFWFTMMYKLRDPASTHTYMGTEVVNGITYDKVSVTYSGTGKETNDEYVLYYNPETHLVDQFYFSLPAMGVEKPVIRMDLQYEKIQGIWVSTVRKTFMPDETGTYQLGGIYSYTGVKFKNGFTKEDLMF